MINVLIKNVFPSFSKYFQSSLTSSTLVKCKSMIIAIVMRSYPNVTLFLWYVINEHWEQSTDFFTGSFSNVRLVFNIFGRILLAAHTGMQQLLPMTAATFLCFYQIIQTRLLTNQRAYFPWPISHVIFIDLHCTNNWSYVTEVMSSHSI